MSCGTPHETDCSEVLEKVYLYLDGEAEEPDYAKIRQHLDECGPCLRQYGLEDAVKALVKRSCGCEDVPVDLRARVLVRLQQVRVELGVADPLL
ncbi:MAG: mycothiol system anti-sigma-R factor [Actinomycetota bacterium]